MGEQLSSRLLGDWTDIIQDEMSQPYFQQLKQFVDQAYEETIVYPNREDIWNAFIYTKFSDVKCVILGQDPYHGPNQAHGLSFSVQDGVRFPPSLRNIFQELKDDVGCDIPKSGNLEKWAKQGVLLLNTALTVEAGKAGSHRGKGWEQFTDSVIERLGSREEPIVFILWGNDAKKKMKWIGEQHQVLTSVHPSPLSSHRGFFGSKPFSQVNDALNEWGQSPIDWCL
ncbi:MULTISPECIES: uracil-DNA glycosylase [unclassified Exiguobacterium]|uniref:uracil-DNA glycosylase n=1 Tax=unclassified Exiguobacterium TaxID=2644629 RepID=UPI001BEC115F|nr:MULTISPECIES: uracil-DNA glycosylase [unclassified Exiguobacterium]MDE0563996.1 uracil-DNA glycosylase [Exiguobacterium sp. B2(2022)]